MIDRLRQMAIFAKTIDHGSFRGAAEALHLSPSVVSHHISQLEDHLGVALLYRSTRRLSLTREGDRLLAATRKMLDAAEGELNSLTTSAPEPSGLLRVTLPSVLSQSDLTGQLADFVKLYPRIRLTLDFSDLRKELISDGFDLAIRMGPKPKASATSRILFNVTRRLVAASEYIDAQRTPEKPADLVGWDWLALTPVQNVPVAFFSQGHGKVSYKPNARIFANDAQALYRLAKAGLGLAVLPEYLAADDVAAGRMRYVLPSWSLRPVTVYAVWPPNAPKHGLTHLLLDHLRDASP